MLPCNFCGGIHLFCFDLLLPSSTSFIVNNALKEGKTCPHPYCSQAFQDAFYIAAVLAVLFSGHGLSYAGSCLTATLTGIRIILRNADALVSFILPGIVYG